MEPQAVPQSQIPPVPPTPKTNNSLIFMMSVLLIVTVGIAVLFYFQIQKLSKELSKYQTQASPTPTATADPTANWKTYINPKKQFTFKYPPSWKDVTDSIEIKLGTFAFILETDMHEFVSASISLVGTPDPFFKEKSWQKQISSKDEKLTVVMTYSTDILGTKGGVKDIKTFDQILSTFKFLESPTPASTSQYTCPASGYVDCMPGPNLGVKFECTSEAVNWYKENCPNFKGRAY